MPAGLAGMGRFRDEMADAFRDPRSVSLGRRDLRGFLSAAEQAAEKGPILGEVGGIQTSGVKTRVCLVAFTTFLIVP
ncbi:MAG: hypothetical protein ABSC48_12570 [Terracidiphilus sp.]|jgi:hypothetical protein